MVRSGKRTVMQGIIIGLLLTVLFASVAMAVGEEPVRVIPNSAQLHEGMPGTLEAAGVPSGYAAGWMIQYPGETTFRNIGSTIQNPTAARYNGALVKAGAAGVLSEPVTLSVSGHTLAPVPARDATCDEAGYPAHYACTICGSTFSDAAGNTPVAAENLVIAPKGHYLNQVPALEATETSDGYGAHYLCKNCGDMFLDADAQKPTSMAAIFVSRPDHEIIATEIPPTCVTPGSTTYACLSCDISYSGSEIPASGHHLEFVMEQKATEKEAGVRGHWACRDCGARFQDSTGQTLATTASLTIPKLSHSYTNETKAPACTEKGYTRHICRNCGDLYDDNNVAALGHHLTEVARKNPTVGNYGWIQHYRCTECGQLFSDNLGRTKIAPEDIYIAIRGDSVKLPEENKDPERIETSAYSEDAVDGKTLEPNGEKTITDLVSYYNLDPNTTYIVTGSLYNKATGRMVTINGEPVMASRQFTTRDGDASQGISGTTTVEFTIPADQLEGTTIVVYEELFVAGGSKVAEHTDINDAEQTVKVNPKDPEIGTHAFTNNPENNKILKPTGEQTIIDVVTYTGLTPGQSYIVSGSLFNKSDNKLLLIGGIPVTAQKSFTAASSSGSVQLVFSFNADGLDGKTLVAYEELLASGTTIAEHKDSDDPDQTITVDNKSPDPEIGTYAHSGKTGSQAKTLGPSGQQTIIDVVTYVGLTPGQSYTMSGAVWDKTSMNLLFIDGRPVTAQKTFTPTEANGSVTLEFPVVTDSINGHTLVVFEELTSSGLKVAEHKSPDDEAQTVVVDEKVTPDPSIGTYAYNGADGTKTVIGKGPQTVKDIVAYENLTPGNTYTVSGTLYNKTQGQLLQVNGQPVTAQTTFTAERASGSIELTFSFNADFLSGTTLVAYEELFEAGTRIAEHKNPNDPDQTVTVTDPPEDPSIRTEAHSLYSAPRNKQIPAQKQQTIVDVVTYRNLTPGKTYTMNGSLYNKTTGRALMVNGQPVTATATFTASAATGSIQLSFTFDADALGGNTLVAFEELLEAGTTVAEHKDPNDPDQTVVVEKPDEPEPPKIGTYASSAEGGKNILGEGMQTITDVVTYANLEPGKTYTMSGSLLNKSTGQVLQVNGVPITASRTFTPQSSGGSISLTFTFDASSLKTTALVAYEELLVDGRVVAEHKDPTDPDQTVTVTPPPPKNPEIGTYAHTLYANSKEIPAVGEQSIVDVVVYKGLTVGKTYTVSGTLYNKTTGNLLTIDGHTIASSKTFTATEESGSVELVFTFNATNLPNTTLVAYEELYEAGRKIAEHKDPSDPDQTVKVTPGPKQPEIGTYAHSLYKAPYNKQLPAQGMQSIVDIVSYVNLIPGQSYTVSGSLYNKNTAELLKVDGREVRATRTFTPTTSGGSVELTFRFDATAFANTPIVVYEELLQGGSKLAEHKDPNDLDQTVTIAPPPEDPEIATQANTLYVEPNNKTLIAEGQQKVVDTVMYKGLVPGKKYTLSGTIYNKSQAESLVIDGKQVASVVEFTPTKSEGTIQMVFTFDATGLGNAQLVVFEELLADGTILTVHKDPNDSNQTVFTEKPTTPPPSTPSPSPTPPQTPSPSPSPSVPTPSPSPTKPIPSPSPTWPTPSPSPTKPVPSPSPTITPQPQNPQIGTYAYTIAYKNKILVSQGTQTITDIVAYTGLTPGRTYTMHGSLYNKATGQLLRDAGGKLVSASTTFTPAQSSGSVQMTFVFDASRLGNTSLVVFEELRASGITVAEHKNPSDPDQTVTVKEPDPTPTPPMLIEEPEIETYAYTIAHNNKLLTSQGVQTITDIVSYTGLVPGQTYTMNGSLYNKATGKLLTVNGQLVTASATFTPVQSYGSVYLTFTFDASGLGNTALVAFEELRTGTTIVAEHKDPNDPDQTVTAQPPVPLQTPSPSPSPSVSPSPAPSPSITSAPDPSVSPVPSPTRKTHVVIYWDGDDKLHEFPGINDGDPTPTIPDPEKPGYDFVGWNPVIKDNVTEDMHYYAQWTPKEYTVTYWDGDNKLQEFKVHYGDDTPRIPNPTKPGYIFGGWTPVIKDIVTGDIDYVAIWIEEEVPQDDGPGSPGTDDPGIATGIVLSAILAGAALIFIGVRRRKAASR